MPPEYQKIVDEIYTALEGLNAPPLLLGIIGSCGDTLTMRKCSPPSDHGTREFGSFPKCKSEQALFHQPQSNQDSDQGT